MAHDRPELTPERLERAASSLKPLEREVLILSSRDHLSNCEIAERLGIAPENAERLLVGALTRLDLAIERQGRPWWRLW